MNSIEGKIEKVRIAVKIHFYLVGVALIVAGYILLNIEEMQRLPFAIWIFSVFAISAVLGVFSLIMLSNTLYKKEEDWVTWISDKCSVAFEVLIWGALISISISGFIYLLNQSGILGSVAE